MGIVNVTSDSFSDGGRFLDHAKAIAHAESLVAAGAHIVDIGGESTRPGAEEVAADEELRRIVPVIDAMAGKGVAVSVDTQKTAVMREVLQRPIAMINDVNALQEVGAITACAASDVAVCVMHRQGTAKTMQVDPRYGDVVAEVKGFLLARAAACEQAGIARSRIVIDQGFGFGKTREHNLALFRAIPQFVATGYPLLIGISRKSLFQQVLGLGLPDRMVPSVVAAVMAVQKGARIVRVHDVRETVAALKLLEAFSR